MGYGKSKRVVLRRKLRPPVAGGAGSLLPHEHRYNHCGNTQAEEDDPKHKDVLDGADVFANPSQDIGAHLGVGLAFGDGIFSFVFEPEAR